MNYMQVIYSHIVNMNVVLYWYVYIVHRYIHTTHISSKSKQHVTALLKHPEDQEPLTTMHPIEVTFREALSLEECLKIRKLLEGSGEAPN